MTCGLADASYLQKPYSPAHLGRRVRDVPGRKQSAKLDRLAVPDVFAGQKLGS
jgi:hypothetical protein